MNKYKKMISTCFTEINKKDIDAMYSFSTKYERRFPMVSNFRETIKEHLKDKGYSKKQIDDLMDMYTAIYTVGFMTGAIVYSMTDDVFKDGLFNF
jgi:hypothetical protein